MAAERGIARRAGGALAAAVGAARGATPWAALGVALGAAALSAACAYERIELRADAAPGTDATLGADAAPGTDAAIDAAPSGPRLASAAIPLRIAVGESVALSLSIAGPPRAAIAWSITSGGGAFAPASGTAVLDDGGGGAIAVTYTAPATAGDLEHALALAGAAADAPFATRVRALMSAGESAPFPDNAGVSVSADTLLGQRVFLPAGVVMRLAVIAHAGGYGGRLALYTDEGNAPKQLVVGSQLAPIATGANEQRVTPTAVAAGDYWLLGNYSGVAPIKRNAAAQVPLAFASLPAAAPLPAVAPTSATAGRPFNYYVQIAD